MRAIPWGSQYSIATHTASDPWVHGSNLVGWSHTYEPAKPGAFNAAFRVACLGGIQLIHERVDSAFYYSGHSWPGSRVLFSYLTKSGKPYYDGRPVGTDAVVTHRWDAVDGIACNRNMELVLVAVDEDFLNREVARLSGADVLGWRSSPIVCAQGRGRVAAFQRTILDALDQLARNPRLTDDLGARRSIQEHVLRSIVDVAVTCPERRLSLPPPSTRAYIVRRATEYMDSRLADPISMADICGAVRVCQRTLAYSFSQVLGVSPSRYLLAARLNGARRDMVTIGPQASIQTIAARWGFWHMSRFALYYRQAFGETPSQTRRRARNPHAASSAQPAARPGAGDRGARLR